MRFYIGLGSNIGDRENNIAIALKEIQSIGVVEKRSTIYESKPLGFKDQDDFLNAVCILNANIDAFNLLKRLKLIEKKMGREKSIKWGPRLIDLDIIDWEGETINMHELTIPHPEMQKRKFVLFPLSEIDPDFVHKNGRTIRQLLDNCPDGVIKKYKEHW